MFTDTKNLVAATNIAANSSFHRDCSSKSPNKLRRALIPLLRRLTKSTAHSNAAKHPNNINLNNVVTVTGDKQISRELSGTDTIDCAAFVRKGTEDDDLPLLHCSAGITAHVAAPIVAAAIIDSASVEKAPMTSCSGCSHGRNCQYAERHCEYVATKHYAADAERDEHTPTEYWIPSNSIGLQREYVLSENRPYGVDDEERLQHAWLWHTLQHAAVLDNADALAC